MVSHSKTIALLVGTPCMNTGDKMNKEISHRATAILAVIMMLATAFTALPQSVPWGTMNVKAEDSSTQYEKTVIDIDLNSTDDVINNIWTGNNLEPPTVSNLSYSYSLDKHAAELQFKNSTDGFFIIKSVPALETEYTIDAYVPYYGSSSGSRTVGFQIVMDHYFRVGITRYAASYRFAIIYYDSSGVVHSWIKDLAETAGETRWITTKIHYNQDRSFSFSFLSEDGNTTYFSGLNVTRQDFKDVQPEPTPGQIKIYASGTYLPDPTLYYSIYVRNYKQTIFSSRNDIFGMTPSKIYSAFGFDGPYSETIRNATSILPKYGYRGTVFYDVNYEVGNPGQQNWTSADMKRMFGDGFEFGIHLAGDYSTYDAANITEVDEEVWYLENKANANGWNKTSFVFTSLGNNYDLQYNEYMLSNYFSIGRKIWGHPAPNLGYLSADSSSAGIWPLDAPSHKSSWVAYLHRISNFSNADMTPQQFENFMEQNKENGIQVVGYMEYYTKYCAPSLVSVDINEITKNYVNFTVEYTKLKVPYTFEVAIDTNTLNLKNTTYKLVDEDGNTVDYVEDGNLIIFDARDGENYRLVESVPTGGFMSWLSETTSGLTLTQWVWIGVLVFMSVAVVYVWADPHVNVIKPKKNKNKRR